MEAQIPVVAAAAAVVKIQTEMAQMAGLVL